MAYFLTRCSACPIFRLNNYLSVLFKRSAKIAYNVSRLGEGGDFTTNVDAENQTLINHKCVCGALNRHFCQTAVRCWRSVRCACKPLSILSLCVIVVSAVRCVFYFFLKRWKFFKSNFYFGSVLQALLKTLVVCRLAQILIVLANCVDFSNSN